MADQTQSGQASSQAGQVLSGQTSQTDAGQSGQGQQSGQHSDQSEGQEPRTFDAAYVVRLRNEAAKYRTEFDAVKQKLDTLESQSLTETQKIQRERDQLAKERDDLLKEQHVNKAMAAAARAGARYPDAVAVLVSNDTKDYEAAIKEVRRKYPDMFRQSSGADGGAGGDNNNGNLSMNDLIRQRVGRR